MKKFKRALVFLLTLTMLLTMIPFSTFAVGEEKSAVTDEITAEVSLKEKLSSTFEEVKESVQSFFQNFGEKVKTGFSELKEKMTPAPMALISGDFEYEVLEDGTAAITRYNGSAENLTILSEIDGYTVTSIGDYAFWDCDSLTSVTIPDSVTSIGDRAFGSCDLLTSVIIPDSVTSIVNYAFYLCTSLTSVTIPDSVMSVEYGVFAGCTSLKNINVDEKNKNYTSLNGVLFDKKLTELICYPAGKMEKNYAIPSGVTSIGHEAFDSCASLTSVTIPDSVTSIGDGAFASCISLTSVTIPNGVTRIGTSTFHACISLTSVTIPNSVTSIEEHAFYGCASLTSVTIPDSVTSIGLGAFNICMSLQEINVSDDNEHYSSSDGVLFNKDKTELICYPMGKKDETFEIPTSVTSIDSSAFCFASLTSVTIPDSVTSIGDYAFYSCESLTSVTIPDSVTSIGVSAFNGCTSLKNIAIPGSVTNIGYYTFLDCDSLTDIYYAGSEEDWKKISIGSGNDCLKNATIHYNSEMPSSSEKVTGTFDDYVTTVISNGEPGDKAYISEVIISGKSYKVSIEDSKRLFPLSIDYDSKKGEKVVAMVNGEYIKEFEFFEGFLLGVDNNSFYHDSDPLSGFYGRSNHNIPDDYIKDKLINLSSSNGELGNILKTMDSKWRGSCYGISAVMGLCYLGYLDINDIVSTPLAINTFYNLPKPCQDERFLSTIEYYHLSQYLKDYGASSKHCIQRAYNFIMYDAPQNILNSYFDSDFYQLLLQTVKEHETVLLGFGEKSGGGHAIITCGLTQTSGNTYEIKLYDMNDLQSDGSSGFDRLVITNNDGKYTAQMYCCKNPTKDIIDTTTYMYFLPLNALVDISPVNKKLSKRMMSRSSSNIMSLIVDYNDQFTINFPDGKHISYDGNQFTGNVEIYDVQYLSDSGNSFGSTQIKLEIERYESFEYSSKAQTNITVYDNDNYYFVSGKDIDSVFVELKSGVDIKGTNFEFEGSANKVTDGEVSVIKISGKAEADVQIKKDESGNIVTSSEKDLEDIIIKELTEDGSKIIEGGNEEKLTFNITLNGEAVNGDVAYVKMPNVGMMYKKHSAKLGFTFDSDVKIESVKWSYAGWSVDNPEANIESPDSAETVIRPNGKGIGARSTWVKLTVTDTDGNVYEKTVKVRFYKWDWQRK